MPPNRKARSAYIVLTVAVVLSPLLIAAEDPLPSWRNTETKQAIVAFVEKVTDKNAANFIQIPERIAVFDNDGTLWAEQPMYFQFAFALDRVKALAPQHPEWVNTEPFASLLKGNLQAVLAGGEHALAAIITATHAGTTTDEFRAIVRDWIRTARHPRFNRPYTQCVYQPMIELLSYLRTNGFKTFIVSGGGVEFMRAWVEDVYGIPPEQVVGSTGRLKFEYRAGEPVLMKLPGVDFVDDKAGKPVGIQKFIGRKPVFAFGNSDGDLEMLQWTDSGGAPRFMGLVHHTDAAREWAYDRKSPAGALDKALDEARIRNWIVVDMKKDWEVVFKN